MPYQRRMVISSLLSLNGGHVAYGVPGSGRLSQRYQGASKSRLRMFNEVCLSARSSKSASFATMLAIGRTYSDRPGSTATGRSEYATASASALDETSTSEASSGMAATKH